MLEFKGLKCSNLAIRRLMLLLRGGYKTETFI